LGTASLGGGENEGRKGQGDETKKVCGHNFFDYLPANIAVRARKITKFAQFNRYLIMRIVVTGAGGQLGQALKERGLNKGTLDLKERGFNKGAPEGWDWLFTDVAELNITDRGAVEAFFDSERPDVVINCAAFTDVDRAETERAAAFSVNRDAPGFLASAAARRGAAMIHISTDFVFNGAGSRPYTEDDAPAPINVYGESKLAGEEAVTKAAPHGAVIRTSWLYSPWGKNFVKSILRVAADREEIRVVSDQVGCPTSADSLAGAIVAMIPRLGTMDLYHFCDSGAVSRADFAAEIIRGAGLECRVEPVASSEYPSPAERPAYSALDTKKIARAFGLATRPWQQPLAECLNELTDTTE
jgi:dTDP-4-dehydrorhamnose reductase